MEETPWVSDQVGPARKDVDKTPEKSLTAIPAEIYEVIGKPVFLQGEKPEEYDALLLKLAHAARPGDMIEWIWISDVASIVWEMRRLRNLRDRLVESETPEALNDLVRQVNRKDNVELKDRLSLRSRIVDHWNSNNSDRRDIVLRYLRRRGVDFDHVYAVVYQKGLDKFAKIDGLIADLGRRRDTVLREIERRREAMARRMRVVADMEIESQTIGGRKAGQ